MRLAEFRDKRCKNSKEHIAEQLTGTWRNEHLFNLKSALDLFDHVECSIKAYDDELLRLMEALTPDERRSEFPTIPTQTRPEQCAGPARQSSAERSVGSPART
jgi:transposase